MIGQRFFVTRMTARGRAPFMVVTVLAVAFRGYWALIVADHDGVVIPMNVEGVGQLVLVTDSRRDRDRARRLTRRKDAR